jgi:phosphoglycerol transferase MdoB-like AlkP superfamily enzyme
MADNSSSSGSGIGFFGLLGVLFIALKLTHVINWSWWWVTIPLWGGAAFAIVVLLIIAVIAGLAMYARVRRHMKASGAAVHEESGSGPEI